MSIGRIDICTPEFLCENCGNVSVGNIEGSNMWKGDCSGQSSYLFDQDLFILYDLLRKNIPGMSELGFIRALEEFSEQKERVSMFFSFEVRLARECRN